MACAPLREVTVDPKHFLSALVVVGLFCLTASGWAQTIQLPVRFEREITRTGTRVNDLSLDDCLQDDHLTFELQVFNPLSSADLEVWVGSNCDDIDNRTGDNPRCWKVFQEPGGDAFPEVEIPVQNIVAQQRPGQLEDLGLPPDQVYEATAADCRQVEETVGFYFMYVGSSEEAAGTAVWSNVVVDTLGPPAPTNVVAFTGERRLFVEWEAPSSSELQGYKFFCAPSGGSAFINDAGAAAAAAAAAEDESDDATDDAGTDNGSDAGAEAGTDAGVDAGTDAGVDASTSSDEASETTDTDSADDSADSGTLCQADGLVEGALPANLTECGKIVGSTATDGSTFGLPNGVLYAVAVSAIDELDNPGFLSNVTCGTPENITTFFDRYVEAGGDAGGGFCSVSSNLGAGSSKAGESNAQTSVWWRPSSAIGGLSLLSLALLISRRTQRTRRRVTDHDVRSSKS